MFVLIWAALINSRITAMRVTLIMGNIVGLLILFCSNEDLLEFSTFWAFGRPGILALVGSIHPFIAIPILDAYQIGGRRKRILWLWGQFWADLACVGLVTAVAGKFPFNPDFLTSFSLLFVIMVVIVLALLTLVHASISSEPGYGNF